MAEMRQSNPRSPAVGICWALVAVLCCLVYLQASAPVTTNDLFWHINTGEHLLAAGEFPERDVFSYTAGHLEWNLHEWLTQVVFYGLYKTGGFPLLRLLTGLLSVGILLGVFHLARRQTRHDLPALLAVMAFAVLGTTRFQTRPTLFTMALFLVLVTWLASHRGRWRSYHAALMVTLVVAWVNLHSVGLLALVIYGAFIVALTLKWFLQWQGPVPGWEDASGTNLGRHALTWAAACGASMFNPAGFQLFAFAFQDKSTVMEFITDEWGRFRLAYGANESLTPESYVTILVALGLIGVVYLLTGLALNRERHRLRSSSMPDPVPVALAVVCLLVGLMARRFHWMVAVALIFALGLLGQHLRAGRFAMLARSLHGRGAAAVATGVAVLMLGLLYNRDLRYEGELLHRAVTRPEFYQQQISPSLDLPAIRFLKDAGLEGNVFCHYGSGGMLSFHLYPAIKVFIDSRIDLYRREIFLDYLAIRAGRPDQIELLDRYDTDIFYRHWEIAPLVDTAGWIPIYRGADGELWLREGHGWRNLELCATYYAEQGVPFSRTTGVSAPPGSGRPLPWE